MTVLKSFFSDNNRQSKSKKQYFICQVIKCATQQDGSRQAPLEIIFCLSVNNQLSSNCDKKGPTLLKAVLKIQNLTPFQCSDGYVK